MPLDLKAANALELRLSGSFAAPREQMQAMFEETPDQEETRNRIILRRNFRIARKRYYETAALYEGPEDYFLLITVAEGTVAEQGEATASELLLRMAALETSLTLDCVCIFSYPTSRWKSVVSLPLRMFDWEEAPFDEVRGVRAVKLSADKKTEYSVVIDRPDNRTVWHTVLFAFDSTLDQELPERILRKAKSISRLLVRARERKKRA